MNQMKVYAVIGGYYYAGEDFSSLQLFYNEDDAFAYRCNLLESGSEYVKIGELEIL